MSAPVPALDIGPAASARVRERDEVLARAGWTRRFIGAPPRLGEMAALYRSVGREVLLEPLEDDDLAHECAGCTLALSLFRVVYTRMPR